MQAYGRRLMAALDANTQTPRILLMRALNIKTSASVFAIMVAVCYGHYCGGETFSSRTGRRETGRYH